MVYLLFFCSLDAREAKNKYQPFLLLWREENSQRKRLQMLGGQKYHKNPQAEVTCYISLFVLTPESSEFDVFVKLLLLSLVKNCDSCPYYHLVLVLLSLLLYHFTVFLPFIVSHLQLLFLCT